MSRKPSKAFVPSQAADTPHVDRVRKWEDGIDIINTLRVEMREAGLIKCADALDEAFAHCIRDFLVLKGEGPDGLGEKDAGDLN